MPTGLKIHIGVFFQFRSFEDLINNMRQKEPEIFTTVYTCTKYICIQNTYGTVDSSACTQQGK